MSTPVDLPQNIQIHVAPAERIPQARKPDKGDNQQQEFQDFFQRSEKDKVHREQRHKREKEFANKHKKSLPAEKPNEYDNNGEQSNDEKPDDLNLGINVDIVA
jgi:hypothetical protein